MQGSDDFLFEIDPFCEQFEDALRCDDSPRIEEFLERWADGGRERLFEALLDLELEYKVRRGEVPDPSQYSTRFREYSSIVHSKFRPSGRSRTRRNSRFGTD